ncbi:MAG: hypothetical protein A2Y28_03135 [Chlamydiae bacterium GWC2_50_10]|nr:MAG: hypothetical protein A2Z85_01575 [Chlamydiae bacterium GWA2_50_15]OGN54255.1 MAG: hypothetical protein A2Y28_03135 [Chlamydiae bacterium GWC2_50_10]OGN54390.1 MAG: hypothetical protein A2098_02080 [Chlamydiae bacterium GWF2_49_8]OGN58777.1 MAG: hypothetical protein A3D18_06125 [Chlamydiae bacterium RIFCSPHIGHO2_02_FULL_49_29]OGN63243.1 MAG: hypothetical protein A3E26_04915 [Chlamydiae bacterium RIFCSPHIGHO2_12_FULL_49_32]OGN68385.1 MAG: hypothetical protein A3I15_04365 [Chlamydiae bact
MRRFFFSIFFLCFEILHADAQKLSIKISAPSAILINAKTGKVLYEKDSQRQMYPASITKVATAYYCLEKKGEEWLNQIVEAPRECLTLTSPDSRGSDVSLSYWLERGGTMMGLKPGERLSVKTLLYGALLQSGNDATNVLAFHCSGSIPKFLEELNIFLKEKGLTHTRFTNPHGLHQREHVTTAFDMALLAKEAMKNPHFRAIVKAIECERPETNKQPASRLVQFNRLLKRGPYYYAKATGIKTGYTSLAKNNLIASAEDSNRSLIAVLLGCEDKKERFRDAIRLFEAAFSEKKVQRTLFAKGYDRFSVEVKGGKKPLKAELAEDLSLTYYPSEEPNVRPQLQWDALEAPLFRNERVGKIRLINSENEVLKSVPLVAVEDVLPTFWVLSQRFFHRFRILFFSLFMIFSIFSAIFIVLRKKKSAIF